MSDKILVDTNILVYAYDRSNIEKQKQAITLLDGLVRHRVGAVSTQVLAEFFVTVTRKIPQPLSIADAHRRIDVYVQTWAVFDITSMIVLEAARGVETYQFSFWDAQIWATARLNQLSLVLSEDFNVGSVIEGVQFTNPFDPSFIMSDWIGSSL